MRESNFPPFNAVKYIGFCRNDLYISPKSTHGGDLLSSPR